MSRWIGTLRVPVKSWNIRANIRLESGSYDSLEPLVSQVRYVCNKLWYPGGGSGNRTLWYALAIGTSPHKHFKLIISSTSMFQDNLSTFTAPHRSSSWEISISTAKIEQEFSHVRPTLCNSVFEHRSSLRDICLTVITPFKPYHVVLQSSALRYLLKPASSG